MSQSFLISMDMLSEVPTAYLQNKMDTALASPLLAIGLDFWFGHFNSYREVYRSLQLWVLCANV